MNPDVAQIEHDLRARLTNINHVLDMLLTVPIKANERTTLLQHAQGEVDRAMQLLEILLSEKDSRE